MTATAPLVSERLCGQLQQAITALSWSVNGEFLAIASAGGELLLLDAVGIPRDLFTPVFAMGRVLGWVAHVWEQEKSGRLIRPQSRYIGAMPVWPTSRAVLAANQKAE